MMMMNQFENDCLRFNVRLPELVHVRFHVLDLLISGVAIKKMGYSMINHK